MALRLTKICLAACVGLLMTLIGFDNIFDYETNFVAVRHILSMDTLPDGSGFMWRAVTATSLHHLAYWSIILTELAAAALCLAGVRRMVRARRLEGHAFDESKQLAIFGLALAFGLYFMGFMVGGGEWFEMWRSNEWNMQEPAFRFVGAIGIVLLFVSQRDS
jgi:predicted small integral membrane protein